MLSGSCFTGSSFTCSTTLRAASSACARARTAGSALLKRACRRRSAIALTGSGMALTIRLLATRWWRVRVSVMASLGGYG